jgi:hypothetical protein
VSDATRTERSRIGAQADYSRTGDYPPEDRRDWRNGVDSRVWPISSQRSASGCGSGTGRSLNRVCALEGLGCPNWPCGQNPGQKPAISRRAMARET